MFPSNLPLRSALILAALLLAWPARAQDGAGALFDAVGDEEQAKAAEEAAALEEEARYKAEVEAAAAKARAEAEAAAAEEAKKKAEEEARAKAAPVEQKAEEVAAAPKPPPTFLSHFAGSSIIYQPAASAISFYKPAEPMWNPYVAQTLIFRPVYKISKAFSASLRFMLSQELTTADDTTYVNEIVLGDAWLDVTGRYKEPTTGIGLSGGLRAVLPLSKVSRRNSLYVGLSPGGTLTRSFEVLEGLSVRYLGRLTFNTNRWTTGALEGSPLVDCPVERASCAHLAQTGVSNVKYGVWHGPGASLSITKHLDFSVDYNLMRSYLYDLPAGTVETGTGTVVLPGAAQPPRYISYFILDLAWQATPSLGLDFGLWTWGLELGPDGRRRNTLFNRDTTLFVSASWALGEGLGAFF